MITGRSRYMKLCVEGVDEQILIQLMDYFAQRQAVVKNLTRMAEYKWYKKDICAVLELDFGKKQRHREILNDIRKLDGIRFVHEI